MSFIGSLHGRAIITSGLLIAAILLLFGYFSSAEESRGMEHFHIGAFSEHADAIVDLYTAAMAAGQMDSVRQVLNHSAHDADISDIRIIRPDGQIVISTAGMEIASDLSIPFLDSIFRSERRYAHRRGRLLSIVKPIGNSLRCHQCHDSDRDILGFLEVDFRFDPSERRVIGFYSRVAGTAVLLIVLMATTLWYFQHRFVQKPIGELMDAIQTAKDGDLSVRVEAAGSAELNRLMTNFNDLINRLASAQGDLQRLHEKQMEHAERLATAGELASGIAHEIKNPLAGISSTIQVLQEARGESYPDQEILTEMATQIKRIEKVVMDLLSYACPSQPEFKEGDINDNVQRCVTFVTPMAEQQETEIAVAFDPNLPRFWIDSGLIDQVVINILMNSLQALRERGKITVSTRFDRNKRMAVLTIADDGPGIPGEMVARVFRPFYTTKHKGSGLGLSICKNNVDRHDGTITVQSDLGKGMTVVISLPVDRSFDELHQRIMI